MRTSVGISLGSANLVAVTGGRPIVRPAAVTVRPGVTVTGFVDRVGDPVPMLAADGSAHRADRLSAAAIEAATRAASPRHRPELGAVAVPGHWSDGAVAALRTAVPHLVVVPDSTAALTAIAAGPGLPSRGVVLLVDLGAGGTSITLADAGAGFTPIGPTVRCDDFSGDLVDQAVLRQILDGLDLDPAGTAAVASLHDLRAESRAAKERLSQVTATAVAGARGPVRVTRGELEALMAEPLDRLIATIADVLHRARVVPSAVVTVGGGARIPLVTQRLSDAVRCPVRTTASPQIAAAMGAELVALRRVEQQATTVAVPAAATMLAPAVPALAWSAEDDDAAETEFAMPTAAPVDEGADTGAARPVVQFSHDGVEAPAKKRPAATVWLAGAACAAAVATAAVLLTVQIARSDETTPASDISTPVAMHALEPSAAPAVEAPPADTVTQTVRAAAPVPQQGAAQPAPAPAAPQGQIVAKEAAPAPVPAAPVPAPAPAAPAPAPAAPAPVWPRIPLPQFTFPAPTSKPSPAPAPSSAPSEPPPTSSSAPPPATSTQAPEPSTTAPTSEAPTSEVPATTTAPVAEPTTASPSVSPSPSA
ncbi:Hsp70 family protein [Mycolicibacterium sp. 3033]|nr:Hsp70 family protein [Mycolicibacterium aurantiacum]